MRYVIYLLAVLIAGGVYAQDDPPVKTGIFTTEFSERSPLSDPDAMVKITRWPKEKMVDYELSDHTFQIVLPKDYDGSESYGLLVFIHPNDQIDLNHFYGRALTDILAKHKMIWVSYNNAGNSVMPNVRLGLALDAAHNMVRHYRIDTKRVYVSGLSGGGRMTCMAGIYYPQVFTGAIPIVGTLYFRDVTLPEDPSLRALIKPEPPEGGTIWPRGLIEPTAKTLRKMTQEQRWVLLAGELDYNMPQMRAHFEQGFERDQFEHAHYLEIKGMGHAYPEAKWYDHALTLLESGEDDARQNEERPADERTQRLAERRLDVALRTLSRDRERGVRALERLIEELPHTDAAKTAREKLETLQMQ